MNAVLHKGALFHWYAWGYTTRERAVDAAHGLLAEGEISWCDDPQVEAYKNKAGARRYGVILRAP